jgi:protein O-mannosyl-transferase
MSHRPLSCALLIATLAGVTYANSAACGFVLDDGPAIGENPAVSGGGRVFASDFRGGARGRGGARTSAYRPWVTLTFAADWAVSGGRAWWFHCTNVLLHIACALALAAGLWRPLGGAAATAAGALFAVHPLHTDAVTSLVGRADVWAALAAMVAWWLHRRRGFTATALAPLVYGVGLLSKESGIVLLPLLALSDVLPHGRDAAAGTARPAAANAGAAAGLATRRERLLRWAGYAAVTAAVWIARAHVVGVTGAPPTTLANGLAGAPLLARFSTGLGLFGRGIELLIAPFELLPDYGPAIVTPRARPDLHTLLGALSMVALIWLALRLARAASSLSARRWILVEAVAWVVVPGVLASNLVVMLPGAFAERWWYLPSAGACALAGFALTRSRPRVAFAACAALTALFAWRTVARNRDWRSDDTLFTAAVAADPRGAFAHYRLGMVREDQHRLAEALTEFEAASAIAPGWAEAHAARATLYAVAGRPREADVAFRAMRDVGGASPGARLNYVRFLMQQGRSADAQRELDALPGAKP